MSFIKFIFFVSMLFVSTLVSASELKVFGSEFCTQYDSGSCINFEKAYAAKNLFWQYKYPLGRKAFDECKARSSQTDGDLAFCSMLFHRAVQTAAERAAMCDKSMLDRYWQTIKGDYAMSLYLIVWKCK